MSDPFDMPEKKTAFPNRSVVVRSSGHRHTVIDVDELLATIDRAGGGTESGGGVPVVDGATGRVVAIAHPDPVDGVYTYVDPRTTVVDEHSGQGRVLTPSGGATVRAVINTPMPTRPPSDPLPPEPTDAMPGDLPLTRPTCDGPDCFVTVDCAHGSAPRIRIRPQPLFSPTNLGTSPLTVMFAGPCRPSDGRRAILQEVRIDPGVTWPGVLRPPVGTDTIYLGCLGEFAAPPFPPSVKVTLRFARTT